MGGGCVCVLKEAALDLILTSLKSHPQKKVVLLQETKILDTLKI